MDLKKTFCFIARIDNSHNGCVRVGDDDDGGGGMCWVSLVCPMLLWWL